MKKIISGLTMSIALLLLAGCGSQPVAPEIVGEPITENIQFGLQGNAVLGGEISFDDGQPFVPPEAIELGKYYLIGDWSIGEDYIKTEGAEARLLIPYNAGQVAATVDAEGQSLIRVMQDAEPVPHALTNDANPGYGVITQKDTVQLIQESQEVGLHTVEVLSQKAGVKIYGVQFK